MMEVFDVFGWLCLLGVCGEIYIGGVGFVMGYVNDFVWIDECFICYLDGCRFYCIGDFGCVCVDGLFEFFGW